MVAKPLMAKFLPFDIVDVGLDVVILILDVDVRAQSCMCDQ